MENSIPPDDQKEEQLNPKPSIKPDSSSSSEASDSENDDEKLKAIMNQEESSSDEFKSLEDQDQLEEDAKTKKHDQDEQKSNNESSEEPYIKQSADKAQSKSIDVPQQTEEVKISEDQAQSNPIDVPQQTEEEKISADQVELSSDEIQRAEGLNMTLEKLCTGTAWAEGPVWIDSASGGYLLWSDIPNNRMMRWSDADGMSVWRDKVEFTNGHTLDLNGDLLHCSHGLRAIFRTPLVNGELRADTPDQIIAHQYLGKRLNSPNDIVVKRDGTIWFTDPPYGILSDHEGHKAKSEQAGHFVYCFNPVIEQLTAMTDAVPLSILEDPNGLAFSPDESTLYVSDTSAARYSDGSGNHHITAFDVVQRAGGAALVHPRIFAVIEPGLPDGFRVDKQGLLYTSSLDSVQVYSSKGEFLRKIPVPEKIGNLCFGGKDGRDMYIAASTSVYRYRMDDTFALQVCANEGQLVKDVIKHQQESNSGLSEEPNKDIKQSADQVQSNPIVLPQQTEELKMALVEESKEQTGSELYQDIKSHSFKSKRINDDHFVFIQQDMFDSDLFHQGMKVINEIAKSDIQRTLSKQNNEDKKEVLAVQKSVASSEEEEEDDDDDDDESLDLSEGAKQRLFDEEMKNDDDDDDIDDSDDGDSDDDDSDSDGVGSNKDSDSFMEEDIANRSLNAEDEDELVVIDNLNYLKYVSDRFNQQTDILEIVDRNERNFKQLAEKMIQQTSFLVQPQQSTDSDDLPIAKRLMHFTHLPSITNTFHSSQSKSGFPYSICAVEHYIGVGSSDGGVRVFDHNERELKLLIDKSVKNIPVVSVDMVRMRLDCIYVVAGHQKGQISLYEIKGLRADHQPAVQIIAKHLKTDDCHPTPVVSIKFFGELSYESQKKIQVVSCDLDGVVYLTYYRDGMLGYQCLKQCFMKNRMGPTFSIAPFLVVSNKFDSSDVKAIQTSPYQQEELLNNSKQTQLVAFGSLTRIMIAQISPLPKELVIIDKPDYIEMGTVPYLDWGYGLSPCCRDKSYPMVAIAWGKILQLALYTNYQKPSPGVTTDETPNLQYDGFYICDFNIDSCFFLSESILFVLVNKKEVRILYTQNFTPGLFDESYQLNEGLTGKRQPQNTSAGVKLSNQQDRRQYFMTLKEKFVGQVSTYAEKDRGYRLLQNDEIKFKDNPYTGNNPQQRSNYNYNPTICKNKDNMIVALGKSSMGQGSLLHWEEYLDLIRKTNQDNDCWLMTLKAALDIYNGKMIGLAGIPDHKETREQMLRDEMKDLLRQNIDSCIKEFQEGACVSTRTLRVALEFCIRVNALDHLFGELFTMFAEAGMEQRFFENLEPFILSGKFKQTKIPKKILVRLIEFYRQKDVEVLEKILLNLNLSKYKNILEVRHICETEFLTSALIHILTNLFDKDNENTVCLQLLCSLYNMMTKSKTVKEKTDIFKLKDYDYNYAIDSLQVLSKKEKLEIEHSQTYIGYKLMWVMRMFLEGKKFPQGTLSAFKWRIYVYDIVRFATNDKFLGWFLAFDPDCFFKLMKTLFLDQEPYEYIQSQHGFIEMYKDSINGLDACMTHIQIVDALQQQVIAYIVRDREQNNGLLSQRGEQSLNAFIFFIAQISRKPTVPVPTQLGVYVVREHLKFYRKLMKIPEITSEALNMLSSIGAYQQTQQQLQGSKKNQRKAAKQDKITRLYLALIKKNEKDVISLLQRMEESGLERDEVSSLLQDAERSPMFKVRVYLMQLQKNHKGCLEVYFKVPAIREDVFTWLNELESRQKQLGDAGSTEDTKESLNKLILNYIPKLVGMDASHTIKLVEQWLMDKESSRYDHLQIVDERLKNDTDLTFKYLSTLLTDKEPSIYNEHQKLLVSGDKNFAFKYKELVLRFVKVLLQTVGEKRYRGMLCDFVKKKYVPIEESQNMIIEFKANFYDESPKKRSKAPREREINEALAILSKRMGESEHAIDLYIKVLLELSQQEVVSALYISNGEVPFDEGNGNQHIIKFDSLVQDIMRICDKVGGTAESEQLWLHAIRSLYRLKSELFDEGSKMIQQKEKKDHKRFATFHMIRVQYFMRRMSEHVSIPMIFQFLEDINEHSNHPIRYQECRAPFEEKMRTELHHENILNNAAQLLLKDLNADFSILKHLHQRGIVNQTDKCDHCKRGLQSRWDPQSVCVYSCGHSFHQRCAQNNGYKCSLCLNEYEEIQQIINQRGARRGGKQPRRSNGDNDESEQSTSTSSKSIERNAEEMSLVVRKSFDIEKEQRNQFLDQFKIGMIKFEAGLAENVLRINYF